MSSFSFKSNCIKRKAYWYKLSISKRTETEWELVNGVGMLLEYVLYIHLLKSIFGAPFMTPFKEDGAEGSPKCERDSKEEEEKKNNLVIKQKKRAITCARQRDWVYISTHTKKAPFAWAPYTQGWMIVLTYRSQFRLDQIYFRVVYSTI